MSIMTDAFEKGGLTTLIMMDRLDLHALWSFPPLVVSCACPAWLRWRFIWDPFAFDRKREQNKALIDEVIERHGLIHTELIQLNQRK